MIINKIKLVNFRSYKQREFGLDKINLVVGENGSGKSNLVEAIFLAGVGKSYRAERESEVIARGEVGATVMVGHEGGEVGLEIGERGKRFLVNGVPRRMMDFVGKLPVVLFSPTDMDLVLGSPGVRRRYLDFVIGQKDREYRRCLVSYEKGLRQRNKLLGIIREGGASKGQLFFWDRLLIKNGNYLTDKRGEYLNLLHLEYDKSEISENRLKQYDQEEIAAGSTLVGPHRDDFVFMVQDPKLGGLGLVDVSRFGSRGEQRMAVWNLKLGEIDYLGANPILLLDDIFSELDKKHRETVVEMVKHYPGQVVMTTADIDQAPTGEEWNIIKL